MQFKEKKSNSTKAIFVILISLLIASAGYVYFSPIFEQNKPTISLQSSNYWNFRTKLKINISDDSGVKYYKVTFKDKSRSVIMDTAVLNPSEKTVELALKPPKLDMFYKGGDVQIIVEAVDTSKWNMLEGNKAKVVFDIKVDTQKPVANVLYNSRYIKRGGSAVVVVKVKDENLQDAYIGFNDKYKFKLQPFYKQDYFVALIAWPIDEKTFHRVNLVAVDRANSKTVTKVPLYIQNARLKHDDIQLSEEFVKNISKNVLEQSFEKIPATLEEIFIYSNKDLRAKNVQTIKEVGQKAVGSEIIENFNIKPFRRLRGSKTVANYGERRSYYLNGKKINEAWHLGIDWASVKHAPIRVSNSGIVTYKDYLGIYGNTIIINHGMGLSSLYAHTSSQDVQIGEQVRRGQKIANTGATGAVFGDHLHFGILIQGFEVDPIEWMDGHWIKTRITNILKKSKKMIDGKK